mgnify:FL=1
MELPGELPPLQREQRRARDAVRSGVAGPAADAAVAHPGSDEPGPASHTAGKKPEAAGVPRSPHLRRGIHGDSQFRGNRFDLADLFCLDRTVGTGHGA